MNNHLPPEQIKSEKEAIKQFRKKFYINSDEDTFAGNVAAPVIETFISEVFKSAYQAGREEERAELTKNALDKHTVDYIGEARIVHALTPAPDTARTEEKKNTVRGAYFNVSTKPAEPIVDKLESWPNTERCDCHCHSYNQLCNKEECHRPRYNPCVHCHPRTGQGEGSK